MIPKIVLNKYDLGKVESIIPVYEGLIHQTYKVEAANGDFILQRLHPKLATPAIAKDFFRVTRFLAEKGFVAPECILSKKGKVLVDEKQEKWRLQTYVAGKTLERVDKADLAYEAGRIFGEFHKVMGGFPYKFLSKRVSHNTKQHFQDFKKAVRKHQKSDLMKEVSAEVKLLDRELPKLFLPKGLPIRVIHGDPKISNIIFARGKAKALIDLDTCGRNTVLVELGDAFRSWCGGKEDDLKNVFRVPIFHAAFKGYLDQSPGFLTGYEKRLVPRAIGLITLELACRFLTDYFEDEYFGWDEKRYESRREHNLARARGQIALYRDVKVKMREIRVAQ